LDDGQTDTETEEENKKKNTKKEGTSSESEGELCTRRRTSKITINRGSIGSSNYDHKSQVCDAANDDSIGSVTFDTSVNETNVNYNRTIQATVSSGNSSSAINVVGSSAEINSMSGAMEPPRIIRGSTEQDNTSRSVSSLTSTAPFGNDDESKLNLIPRIGMTHHHSGSSVCYPRPMVHPVYNNHHHESNHYQRNIFVQPPTVSNIESSYYTYDDRTNSDVILKHIEEKKELSQKVKELEYRLASQKEKYDDVKEELRDAKTVHIMQSGV
jgi:hypothetical protein